jgi:GTP-binding protein HflX
LPVNDRTLLILEIFAQRARSHEGKLQVELARLQYLSTRLVRRWSHLERQRAAPACAVARAKRRSNWTAHDRRVHQAHQGAAAQGQAPAQTQRRQRERRDAFNISLVGYTNAGKSTLFNALVKARAYAADQLFATLDTTTRQLYLGEAGGRASVSLSDTVGFIRDLPHGLIDAFQATLQEAVDADLLLHVVDAANPGFPEQIDEVQRVLAEIGAADIPQVLVFNKLDALEKEQRRLQLQDMYELMAAVPGCLSVPARARAGGAARAVGAMSWLGVRLTDMTPDAAPELHRVPKQS